MEHDNETLVDTSDIVILRQLKMLKKIWEKSSDPDKSFMLKELTDRINLIKYNSMLDIENREILDWEF